MRTGILILMAVLVGAGVARLDADRRYATVIDRISAINAVKDELNEERCNDRIATVLYQIDMECFGRWTTADGPITLYPETKKEAQ